MAATRKQLAKKELALDGALKTYEDPTKIKPNDFQTLTNLRYRRGGIKAVGGMSAITSSSVGSTMNNMFHYRKTFPNVETHLLASRTAAGNSYVYDNTTAIPSAGNFGSAIFTGSGATDLGRFSVTPNGGVAFCDGKNAALWYGDYFPVSQFIVWDRANGSIKYNYTEQVTNTLSSANNLATLYTWDDSPSASVTGGLYHFESLASGVVVDSSGNGNDGAAAGSLALTTSSKKFGTYAGNFKVGSSPGWFTIPHDAIFNFNTTGFCIDFWIYDNASGTVFFKSTDDSNYMRISVEYNDDADETWLRVKLSIKAGGTEIFNGGASPLTTPWVYLATSGNSALKHVAVQCNTSGNYSIYIDGSLKASVNDTQVANYTGDIYIGTAWLAAAQTDEVDAVIDELRIDNTARYTESSFDVPTLPYGSTNIVEMYIGSMLPLGGTSKGIYFDLVGVNAGTSSQAAVYYWDGSDWASASATDGTISGGESLGQDGVMSFATGKSTHKPSIIDDIYLYWYKIVVVNVTSTVTVATIKLSADMQQIRDLWDGMYTPSATFAKFDGTQFYDYTPNVFETWFDDQNIATYADISTLPTTGYIVVGSTERLAGINLGIAGDKINTNQAACTAHYWSGSAWVPMNTRDGTSSVNRSLSRSGTITWEDIGQGNEFRQSLGNLAGQVFESRMGAYDSFYKNISSSSGMMYRWAQAHMAQNVTFTGGKSVNPDVPGMNADLYFYKLSWNQALSGTVWIYAARGIPSQTDLRGFKFPLMHDDRLWLCNNVDYEPSVALVSAPNRPQVFNGEQSGKLYFGDNRAIIGGVSFSNQFAATTQKMAMFFKDNEVWKVMGEFPYTVHQVSDTDGLVAPLSLVVSEMEVSAGFKRKVAVWLSQRGVVMSDGNTVTDISMDIKDLFEPTHSNYIGASNLAGARGFVDSTRNEYHLVIPSSSEWVFSFDLGKWFKVDRGSYKLQGGGRVLDTNSAEYTYGYTSGGAVYRLENGTQNVDEAITCTLRTADLALDQNYITEETTVRGVKVIQRAKESLGGNMTVKHYGDSSTTATTLSAINPSKSGYRLDDTARMYRLGPHIFHSIELILSSSAQSIPLFEPEFVSILYERAREDVRA